MTIRRLRMVRGRCWTSGNCGSGTILLVAFMLTGVSIANAAENCKAKILKNGVIEVRASNVAGNPRWGASIGSTSTPFFDEALCFNGSSLSKCHIGDPASLSGITPPAGCRICVGDDGPTDCCAFPKGCVPGIRLKDASFAADDPRVEAIGSDGSSDIYFTGVNVHIVNGEGGTATSNGLGNLIIGYGAATQGQLRTGSHNLVVGDEHEYTSYGGIVGGYSNTITGVGASVLGGAANQATGYWSTVSGGYTNQATGYIASVGGGNSNTASGVTASVSGGIHNVASGDYSAVSGGSSNLAGTGAVPSFGGVPGTAQSVSGGFKNMASGWCGSISGGALNEATGEFSAVSGGQEGKAIGNLASVSGGFENTAAGSGASVSGGDGNSAPGDTASVCGGFFNEASGQYATASGGSHNIAGGQNSSVSGGTNNNAAALNSSISGGGGLGFLTTNGWKAGSVGGSFGPAQFVSQ